MFVEAFHNRLKTFYMDRKPNKRVDDLLNLLLRIEEEDFVRRLKATQYTPTVQEKPKSDTRETRHKRGLKIKDESLDTLDQNHWHVRSQTDESVWHTVTAIQDECSEDHCFEKCHEVACVGLCGHMYHCNCDDSSLLCKHIHKVHAFLIRIKQKASKDRPALDDDVATDPDDIDFINLHATVELSTPVEKGVLPTPTEKLLESTKGDIAKLGELIGHEAVTQILPHISGTIKNLLAQCNAVINAVREAPTQPMPQSKIAPNQRLELQPMKRPPKRKPPPSVFTLPSRAQKKDISSSLITTTTTVQPPVIKKSKLSLNRNPTVKAKPLMPVPIRTKPTVPVPTSAPLKTPSKSSFTPCWSSVPDPTEIILRNGPHGLTMLDVKSLEPAISRGELLSATSMWPILQSQAQMQPLAGKGVCAVMDQTKFGYQPRPVSHPLWVARIVLTES
ncbi:uncharacterized protein LOC135491113 [Lineus longissimus]|uniref:uncharacterized protein LOC135491113 n=1 Tax=Lineus longissimus TaxID=88925 RepID=UPI00315C69F2